MTNFKKPNLEAHTGATGSAFLSVHADRQTVSVSCRAREQIGATPGKHLTVAIDGQNQPWVGVVDATTEQGEPEIHGDQNGGTSVNCTLLARHLVRLVEGDPDESVRFHLSGETEEDSSTGATLHRLEVPEFE